MARSGDDVAAGDGLGAFGAAPILAVQMHFETSSATAGQWVCTKPSHTKVARLAEYQDSEI